MLKRRKKRTDTPAAKYYTIGDKRLTLRQWAKELNVPDKDVVKFSNRVYKRLSSGKSVEEAILTPNQAGNILQIQPLGAKTTPWRKTNHMFAKGERDD